MRHAFSLVELSIVLVILGLLTGGILAGQSLIRAAELRSVPADLQRYISAVHTFRDKYMALPGDMRNAVQFWTAQAGGTADGMDSTCASLTIAAVGTATCNGDGDGRIGGSAPQYYETFRAWQQMANSGLIEGSYAGIAGTVNGYHTLPGYNVPRLRTGSTHLAHILYWSPSSGATNYYDTPGGNGLLVGTGYATGVNSIIYNPEDTWNIDMKIDDGKPATGKQQAYKPAFHPNCATSATSSAEYNLSRTEILCGIVITGVFF